MRDELMRPAADPVEAAEETTLRPRRLDEFVGQPRLKEHLEIVLGAARLRGQAADHLLFAGPPGLGKTTMAGQRSGLRRMAPARPTSVCNRPSEPRSPAPCRARMMGLAPWIGFLGT